MTDAPEHGYLIHKQGCGWYRAKAWGYTSNVADAGRFSLKEAIAHSHPNGPSGPRDGLTYRHASEVLPPAEYVRADIYDVERARADRAEAERDGAMERLDVALEVAHAEAVRAADAQAEVARLRVALEAARTEVARLRKKGDG